MRRKITDTLLEWKNRKNKGCALIHGARQVGKTYSALEFARSNYSNVLYIDFNKDREARRFFNGPLDTDNIVMGLSLAYPDTDFVENDTVIILDEIQECPNARASLKFFADDGRYDVIATGSLLGIRMSEVPSMPVGRIEHIWMFPMDFEEFLWAIGVGEKPIGHIRRCITDRKPIGESIMGTLTRYFDLYTVIGGMPAAVTAYLDGKRLNNVRRVQANIIEDYKSDISKHCDPVYKTRTENCFSSVSRHLAKDSRRFVYSDVDPDLNYKVGYGYYAYSLDWLIQAGIAIECRRVSDPHAPSEQNGMEEPTDDDSPRPRNIIKMYMQDTGLLTSLYDTSVALGILDGDITVNRGAIAENFVASMLHAQGRRLLFFEIPREMELDFILVMGGEPVAVEVKSGRNRTCHSLNKAMDRYGMRGVMLDTGDIRVDDKGVVHFPLFAASFMDCIDPRPDRVLEAPPADELDRMVEEAGGDERAHTEMVSR